MLSGAPSVRTLPLPFVGSPPSRPHHFPKALPPHLTILRVRFQSVNSGDTNIQIIVKQEELNDSVRK